MKIETARQGLGSPAPLQHGQELLDTWPYATRLYTRMSPHEMITDPMFAEVMPWAERIVEFPAGGGAPVTLVDNTALIDEQLDAWNAQGPCAEEMGADGGMDTTAGDDGPGPGSGNPTSGGDTGPAMCEPWFGGAGGPEWALVGYCAG